VTRGEVALRILPGLTPYDAAHRLQLETVARRRAGEIGDVLFLLEHPPVITLGRNADAGGVVASGELLAAMGIEVRRIERGGQATYHGPGQIVGYPVIDLHERRLGIAAYVSRLEEAMILAAAALGVEAARRPGITGVFAADGGGKIGAIGVRVTRGVTYHGFAFNVAPDLSHYRLIIPCGMTDTPVTSVADIHGAAPGMDVALQAVADGFAAAFGVGLVAAPG
jgi:lipoyl(octanoyl) transferase